MKGAPVTLAPRAVWAGREAARGAPGKSAYAGEKGNVRADSPKAETEEAGARAADAPTEATGDNSTVPDIDMSVADT